MNGDSAQRQQIVAIKQFLRDAERDDLVKRIRNPKPTAEGVERRKPRPFSDEEIKQFLRVAPPRVGLFFRTQISTGLAICDATRLRAQHLQDGCVRISRLKTGKPVRVRISESLFNELRVALPFYEGHLMTGIVKWSSWIRNAMCRAGIYKRRALTHRCRDTFVDRQLAANVPLPVIAAAIGDIISTVEKHYVSLESMRMRQQIMQAPAIEIPAIFP